MWTTNLLYYSYIYGAVLALSLNTLTKDNGMDAVEVNHLHIQPPYHTYGDDWYLNFTMRNREYQMILSETHTYTDEFISVRRTQGAAQLLVDNQWNRIGSARFVFDITNPEEIGVQGSFSSKDVIFHLECNNFCNVKQEAYLKKTDVESPNINMDSSFILRTRSGSDGDDANLSGSWPTKFDLTDAVRNDVAAHCFNRKLEAKVGVAADSNFVANFKSVKEARLYITNIINKASQIWEEAFNISLVLNEIVTASSNKSLGYSWDIPCNYKQNSIESLQTRLQAISTWREQERADDGLTLWSLLTDCPSGDVVGLAWQATVCESNAANIIHHSILDYRVLAHETGHVFGAVHDCTNSTCNTSTLCCPLSGEHCDAHGSYIMNPGTDTNQNVFSSCTRNNVCEGILGGHTNVSCLNTARPSFSYLSSKKCEFTNDPLIYEECLRNIQCVNFMNSTSSYFCGRVDRCELQCYDPNTLECYDTGSPLLDRTPCGLPSIGNTFCVSGKCKKKVKVYEIPVWAWILIAISGFLGLIAIMVLLLCFFCQIISQFTHGNQQEKRVPEISKPKIFNEKPLGNPTGLPPILKYTNQQGHEDLPYYS